MGGNTCVGHEARVQWPFPPFSEGPLRVATLDGPRQICRSVDPSSFWLKIGLVLRRRNSGLAPRRLAAEDVGMHGHVLSRVERPDH